MSITNENIVIFSPIKMWENKYETPIRFIAEELSKKNKVLIINGPYTIKDMFTSFVFLVRSRRYRKLIPFSNGEEKELFLNKNIILINPPILFSINFLPKGIIYRYMHKINHMLIAKRVKKALIKYNLTDIIFINSFNFLYESLDVFLNPKLNVYHCIDELINPVSLKHGSRQENAIIKRADLVIVTSQGLMRKLEKLNPQIKVVYNAAYISHFNKALNIETKVPESIKKIPKPIIGYYGYIERRFDFEVIQQLATKHPNWNFVLMGSVMVNYVPSDFESISNIHFVDYQPYELLPGVLKGIDIAMIPYKTDEVSDTIFPIKISEYLGAGKPVIMTNFNEDLRPVFGDVVHFVKDVKEFEENIIKILSQNNDDFIKARLAVAENNSWETRGKEFSIILNDALQDT